MPAAVSGHFFRATASHSVPAEEVGGTDPSGSTSPSSLHRRRLLAPFDPWWSLLTRLAWQTAADFLTAPNPPESDHVNSGERQAQGVCTLRRTLLGHDDGRHGSDRQHSSARNGRRMAETRRRSFASKAAEMIQRDAILVVVRKVWGPCRTRLKR
jgi:hypothetical protein